ncbi:ATP-binding cassette domain-containing protein [Granulicatella sp. zg-ZJ]|uniref:ABC transporter ATP-binding protein n=1 Tax=Granulicatella sp. zg-ZJ TaxID=2678504 RepID=UPI0013D5F353|nr:ABC transporter ATP-binding protein [Granulicatella sp. zg-ZJ]NEW63084.1 ATP-binding cassette domain-containing protein [Granulicatella sp. zg-ZJ]
MLEVQHLQKSFGELKAVDDVSFKVNNGKILGLIGKNGAGKSTIFRLILDFITADRGTVLWNNHPFTKEDSNDIGYLPEERGLSIKLTIEEQLLYFAELRGKTKKEISPKINEWLKLFDVKGKRKDKIKTLSKGNQQKVQVIATLIHEPKLIILDEPFSGLDPLNAELLKKGILSLRDRGACVIFSSHNMENVSELCDELLMIDKGQVVLQGSVQEIRESFGRTHVFLESKHTPEELLQVPGVKSVVKAKHNGLNITLENEEAGKILYEYVTKDGYIQTFSQQPLTLEEIFKLKAGEHHE